jgi:hypothetical protein
MISAKQLPANWSSEQFIRRVGALTIGERARGA